MQACHPEPMCFAQGKLREGARAGHSSCAVLRMTKRDGLFFRRNVLTTRAALLAPTEAFHERVPGTHSRAGARAAFRGRFKVRSLEEPVRTGLRVGAGALQKPLPLTASISTAPVSTRSFHVPVLRPATGPLLLNEWYLRLALRRSGRGVAQSAALARASGAALTLRG